MGLRRGRESGTCIALGNINQLHGTKIFNLINLVTDFKK
jgi:hypothetical protein